MNKIFIVILAFVLTASSSFAETYNIGIVSVLDAQKSDDATLAFGTDGRVYEIDSVNIELIRKAKYVQKKMLNIEVELTELVAVEDALETSNEITEIYLESKELTDAAKAQRNFTAKDISYNPALFSNTYITDFSNYETADYQFSRMRRDTRGRSQCYNRAHVWSWELHRNFEEGRRIQTGKIWIFFTRKYIREYRYKWWFHIAPYIKVSGVDHVLDRSYGKKPQLVQSWTDNFMYGDRRCSEVYNYTDYKDNQNSTYCYIMKTSFAYWQPFQIESLESTGEGQSGWNSGSLKKAYKNAIGWRAKVPEL